MHFKLIVQFEMKSIMIIKFNIGVFVFTEKIQVIKLGQNTDPLVKPTQHSPPRVPIALRDKIKEKLEDLESKGIVEKVTIPTERISSMVVVTTPSKIRICLDPQDLNKAVIRPKH